MLLQVSMQASWYAAGRLIIRLRPERVYWHAVNMCAYVHVHSGSGRCGSLHLLCEKQACNFHLCRIERLRMGVMGLHPTYNAAIPVTQHLACQAMMNVLRHVLLACEVSRSAASVRVE